MEMLVQPVLDLTLLLVPELVELLLTNVTVVGHLIQIMMLVKLLLPQLPVLEQMLNQLDSVKKINVFQELQPNVLMDNVKITTEIMVVQRFVKLVTLELKPVMLELL